MNDALFLFLILLLGLVLCSFLGGNCGKEGMTTNATSQNLEIGATYTDTSGNIITVISNESLNLVQVGQTMPIVLTTTAPSGATAAANTYYAQPPLKFTATIVAGSNGKSAINIKLANGQSLTFTQTDTGSTGSTDSTGSTGSTSSYTNYDSYNHYSGTGSSTQLQTGTVFTDVSGNTITVIVNSDGSQSLQLVQISQPNYPITLVSTPPSGTTATVNTYYAQGPLKMTATVYTGGDGQTAIKITLAGGQTTIFSQSGSGSITSTQYYGSTGSPYQTGAASTAYTGSSSTGSTNGSGVNYAQSPSTTSSNSNYNPYNNGSSPSTTSSNSNYNPYNNGSSSSTQNYGSNYYSSLPPGIPSSQIPSGQEDLYILKSQVVPPVCPVCPSFNSSSGSSSSSSSNDSSSASKCPPCPACDRCPEPSFECKKVPNYNSTNNSYLPQPIINSFSGFGM